MFAITFMIWGAIAAASTCAMGLVINKNPQIYRSILAFVAFYIFSWLFLPPIAFDMIDTWWMLILVLSSASGLTWFGLYEDDFLSVCIAPIVVFVVMIIGAFFTSGIFNSREMANVIDIVDHGQKETSIELVSQEQARRVTPNLALKQAAELIGSAKQPGLASVAMYGAMYGNVTAEGKAIWVSPLEPSGFWRWVSSPVTPGYFVTSHVNIMDSRLVEDQPIAYGGEGFYFSKDLSRHLYLNGYINYRYGYAFFQIDDEGVPYYVVPMERPQVGFYSYYPEKWAIVNATTGDIQDVTSHEDLPGWIDRAYSISIMRERLKDWGCLSAGWWACTFSGIEVTVPTPGMVVTMDSAAKMIYYTGTQFQNNKVEGATSGVVTINARTGKTEFYRRAGITEDAAVAIINGAVANFAGRDAEKPVLVQVNGLETYFSVITDASGAMKGYGMVWQRNRNVYGTGDTVGDAMRDYLRRVRNNKSLSSIEGNSEVVPDIFEGIVVVITPVSRKGDTSFYVRIDTVEDKVFVINLENPSEVATTKVGEPVRISAFNAEPGTIDVDSFDNLLVTLSESDSQIRLSNDTSAVMQRYEESVKRNDTEVKLKGLSADQVNQLLQLLKK